MRARAVAALVALLLPSLVAGCFGGARDEGLAQPTDKPVVPPTPISTPQRAVPTPDFRDAGYVTNVSWHVGDAWDYVAPSGHYRAIRVVATRAEGNVTLFQTSEAEGVLGNPPNIRYSRWIDATHWWVLNQTAERGLITLFTPPAPERYLHNGSYHYNVSSPEGVDQYFGNVLYTSRPKVTLAWNEILSAGRFEHRIVVVPHVGGQLRQLAVHVFAQEYGNDVSYQASETAETYTLTAVRYGVSSHGSLIQA